METLAIVGVGLIGGSFALALRKAGFAGEILGVSSKRTIDAALAAGVISRGASLEEAARCADVLYLAQPIDQILRTLEVLGPLAGPACLITDAGSTKSLIVAKAVACIRSASFIGGHPMAGKEQRGVEHADAGLFRSRPYVLTPISTQTTPPNSNCNEFRLWLTKIGARIIEMTPERHDRIVALTSHVPQLLSTTLAASLDESGDDAVTQVFGPGLMDMTRLALSVPELWMSVLETNKLAVLEGLRIFQNNLAATITALESGDINPIFARAARFAAKIR
jgi:prephenate dehydrogenase